MIVRSYFGGIKIRFTVDGYTTPWQRVENEIITGCTISPIVFNRFVVGVGMVTRAAERETRGQGWNRRFIRHRSEAFCMILQWQQRPIYRRDGSYQHWKILFLGPVWKFKPKKCKCLVLRKGPVDRRVNMQVQGEEIPSVVGNPIKCLGKWFNESIIDKVSIEGIKKLHSWLRAVDGNGLPRKHKAWIYQHGILPRLIWLLLVYEI